jgi:hypothetical protein
MTLVAGEGKVYTIGGCSLFSPFGRPVSGALGLDTGGERLYHHGWPHP